MQAVSWLGFLINRGSVSIIEWGQIEDIEYDSEDIRKFKLSYASVGVGYGYNFVPNSRWLIHLSTLPTIVFWRDNKIIKMVGVEAMGSTFPEIAIVARFSLVHYFKHFFMGLTMVYNYTSAGDYEFTFVYGIINGALALFLVYGSNTVFVTLHNFQ